MEKNYNDIENALSKRYNGLLSAVSSPDALLLSETVKERRKENKNDQSRSSGPAAYWLAAALTLVLTVGVTLFGIKMLNTLGTSAGTDTITAAETTGAEDTVRRMIIKAKTYVFGEETNNIDLNGSVREFEVVVSFENVSDLKSASLKISWEKPGLTLKNAEYMVNGLTNTPDKPWSEVQNSYVFNWLALDAKDEIKSRTKFVKLTFRGSDDIKPGTVVIKIEPDQSNIFDSNSNDVPYTLESETVYFDFLHYTLPDTADHSTKEPDPDPDTYYPEYLIVSDDNEEIQVKAYEESADGATDVSVLRYDGSKIKPEFSGITVIEGVIVEKIGIKADGVPGDYYENYINDYLETKNTGVYRFVVSYEITNNGISERWEYPFDVEVWIKSDTTDPDPETTTVEETTTAPETTVPEETTAPEETTTAEETTDPADTTAPQPDDIMNYLEFKIVDPKEDESNLLISQYGTEKFAQLTGIKECSFESVVIPSEYNGYPVKSVTGWYDDDLFMNIKGLTYVEFPDSVIYIEHTLRMFKGNKTLTAVKLPKNLKKISEDLFYGCESLRTVTMPETLETIGKNAFNGCKNLRIDTVPSTVKTIGGGAFTNCPKITKFTVPEGVLNLGGGAFQYCSNLKEITLPDTLMAIGGECFCSTSIKSIVIPQNKDYPEAPTLGESLFAGCSVLEHVQLPDGLTSIPWQMFSSCARLKELDLPLSVEYVDISAFNNSGIKKIKLGKYVHTIVNSKTKVTDLSKIGIEIELDPDSKYIAVENNIIIPIYDRYTIIGATPESVYGNELDCFVDYLSDSVKNKYTRKFYSEMTDEYKASLNLPENYESMPFEELYNYISWLKPAKDDAEFSLDRIRLSNLRCVLTGGREAEVWFYVSDGLNHNYEVGLNVRRNDEIWQIVSVKNIKL